MPGAGLLGFLDADPLSLSLLLLASTVALVCELAFGGVTARGWGCFLLLLLPLYALQLWIAPPLRWASHEIGPAWPQEPTIAHIASEGALSAVARPSLAVGAVAAPPAPVPAGDLGAAAVGREAAAWEASPPSRIETVSVVLPCAEERDLALKTASRFCERTPEEELHEIVVVDDGSYPPLEKLFTEKGFNKERCKLVMRRHEETIGLMAAKQTGGKAATGDVVAFFDCHVAPKPGWYDEILSLIRANPRRMVVPAITDLDLDTFDEKVNSAVNAKCYLTWDADFKWFDDESDYIPTISGGLVAMSRWWFNGTGGFDEVMRGWGGENLDQSLRSWLCGGEIMRAKSSRIAHMWRTGDHRTRAHYRGSHKAVNNRGRVVAAWYDVFAEKYPGRKVAAEEVQNFAEVKRRLGCRPFAFFLYRFRHVYIDAGIIPEKVFQLRERKSGLCLQFAWSGTTFGKCQQGKKGQVVQLGNRDLDEKAGKCCSGIRIFGGNDCMDYVTDGVPFLYSCDVSGRNANQHWRLRPNGFIEKGSDRTCVGPPQGGSLLSEKARMRGCGEGAGVFEEWGAEVPLERTLYESEVKRLGYDQIPSIPDN